MFTDSNSVSDVGALNIFPHLVWNNKQLLHSLCFQTPYPTDCNSRLCENYQYIYNLRVCNSHNIVCTNHVMFVVCQVNQQVGGDRYEVEKFCGIHRWRLWILKTIKDSKCLTSFTKYAHAGWQSSCNDGSLSLRHIETKLLTLWCPSHISFLVTVQWYYFHTKKSTVMVHHNPAQVWVPTVR